MCMPSDESKRTKQKITLKEVMLMSLYKTTKNDIKELTNDV